MQMCAENGGREKESKEASANLFFECLHPVAGQKGSQLLAVLGFQPQEMKPWRYEFCAQPWTYYKHVTQSTVYESMIASRPHEHPGALLKRLHINHHTPQGRSYHLHHLHTFHIPPLKGLPGNGYHGV